MCQTLQYLTDEHGDRTAMVMPISDQEKLLKDLDDLAVVAERRDEPVISHDALVADLQRDGTLLHPVAQLHQEGLRSLPRQEIARVIEVVGHLATEPLPYGSQKLSDSKRTYRIRVLESVKQRGLDLKTPPPGAGPPRGGSSRF